MILELDLWQGISGLWYVSSKQDLANDSGAYWKVARALGMSPRDYLQWVITTFSPDDVYYNDSFSFVSLAWADKDNANKFKLIVNRRLKTGAFS